MFVSRLLVLGNAKVLEGERVGKDICGKVHKGKGGK